MVPIDALSIDSRIGITVDVDMPRLGLGTYKSAPGEEVRHSVEVALQTGYRAIDTAALYANETDVGEAARASALPREDLFITTKVWNADQGYESTRAAFDASLARLGMDYVDLYLVHWPIRAKMEGTWRAMEELLGEGRTRAIGVCNHLVHHLEALHAIAEVPPAVDQIEFHPWLQQPALQAYLAEHDITLEAWAPVMRGHINEVPELARIAERHGVSAAQVSIRWILQQGYVAIPKSVHDERVRANADVFGFELTDDEMRLIGDLDRGHRLGGDPDSYAW